MNNQRQAPRKPPMIPGWLEQALAFAATVGIWGLAIGLGYPVFVYVPAMVIVYLAVYYLASVGTEKPRFIRMALQKRYEVLAMLEGADTDIEDIDNRVIKSQLKEGVKSVRESIDSLDEQSHGKALSGFEEVHSRVRWVTPTLTEYVDIQNHPRKAGSQSEFLKTTTEFEEGFAGFCQWANGFNAKANKGDLEALSTNKLLLRSMRSLITKPEVTQ